MINFFTKEDYIEIVDLLEKTKKSTTKDMFKFIAVLNLDSFTEFKHLNSFDFVYLEDNDFDDVDEDIVFDFFIEIINNDQKIYVKNYENFINNELISTVISDLDFETYIINKEFEISKTNPNLNFFTAYLEIMGIKDFSNKYRQDFFENVSILVDKRNIYLNNELIGSLNEYEFRDLYEVAFKKLKFKEYLKENNDDYLFGHYLPNTNIFVFENENIEKKIENFKITVFNIIKDLSEEEFFSLPANYQQNLFENEYIPLKEIKKLLN